MKEPWEVDIENEKEWRRLMYKEIKEVRKDLHLFKVKTFGFVTVLVALAEALKQYLMFKGGK